MNPPRETLVSRKTQQDVRLQLDKLDYTMLEAMLRRVIREELETHEVRKGQQSPAHRVGTPAQGFTPYSIGCSYGMQCDSLHRCFLCPRNNTAGRAYG